MCDINVEYFESRGNFFNRGCKIYSYCFFSHVRHQRGTFRILGKFFEIVIVWKNRIVFTFFYFLAQLVTFWILETFSDHHCMGNSFFFFFMSDMNVTGSRSWGSFFTSKLCEIFFCLFFYVWYQFYVFKMLLFSY